MTGAAASRDQQMRDFLRDSGWEAATFDPLPGDASSRRYIRIRQSERSAMVMDQPQNTETPAASAGATPEERRTLGYNAVARLAGADCGRFAAVATYLRRAGLAAPEIYAAEFAQGFLILEDFGDNLYADALATGADASELYSTAIDALVSLHHVQAPVMLDGEHPLFAYDETALLAETDLLTEWFLPAATGASPNPDQSARHRELWQAALASLPGEPRILVHRDFHAQNLFWRPQLRGVARTGMIDFQDAVAGARAYDLISLLEDARRDVAPQLGRTMTERYLELAGIHSGRKDFLASAAILAAQRNAKIIGIFARLAKRDRKPHYLNHLPRVWRYMENDLEHPALHELKAWYDRNVPHQLRDRAGWQGERR